MDSASNGFNATRARLLQEQPGGSRAVNQAQTPLAADDPEHCLETKAPWPSTVEYQPRWSSTGHPPSPLSPGSLREVQPHCIVEVHESEGSVSIHFAPNDNSGESSSPDWHRTQQSDGQSAGHTELEMPSVEAAGVPEVSGQPQSAELFPAVPATRSTSFADLNRQQQLDGIADFLDFADLLSLAHTSKANNGFVRITFPKLTDLSQKRHLALEAGRLFSWQRRGAVVGLLGGTLAVTGVVTHVAAPNSEGGDAAAAAQVTASALFQVIFGVGICITRLRWGSLSQHPLPANQAFRQASDAFEGNRRHLALELESRRAIAQQPAETANASTEAIATTQEAASSDAPSPDSPEEPFTEEKR